MNWYYFVLFVMTSMLTVVGMPLPVSMPPRPEEPALVRIAPTDSLAFVGWSGSAEADPDSNSRTERLAAEPEVRGLVTALRKATVAMLGQAAGGPAAGLAQRTLELVFTGLQRPGCVFVQSLDYDPRPSLAAGIAIKLDDDLAGARGVLGALELAMRGMAGGAPLHQDVEVDDVTFHAMPVDTEHSFLGWAEVDGWLLVAVGKETPRQMVQGLRGTSRGLLDNDAFARLQTACAVARPAVRSYVDAARLFELLRREGGGQAVDALAALGLGQASAALATTGLEGDGACYRLKVLTPEHEGLLGALQGPPLGVDDLLRIPRDADLALATRIDALAFEKGLVDLYAAFFGPVGPRLRDEYEREFVAEFREKFGVDWREDVLGNLGDQLVIWDAPSQGGALFTAAAGTVSLQDGAAFRAAYDRIMARLAEQAPTKAGAREGGERLQRNAAYLERFTAAGDRVWWVDAMDDDMPFAPAWTVTDDHLIAALMPQSIRGALAAGDAPNPDQSLLRLPELNRRGAASALLHLDMQGIVERGYPALLMLLQVMGREWQREGFDFDLADVPAPAALLPHLGREITLLEPVEDGWAITRTGTLPVADPLTVLLLAALTGLAREL